MQIARAEFCSSPIFHIRLAAALVLVASLLLSSAASAADPVGVLKFTRGVVTIVSVAGETRRAGRDDELNLNELVVTGAASLAVIQLSDDSRMVVRPNSEFRVELLNADAADNRGQSAVLSLLRGGLRLATGLISRVNPGGYQLNTPVATIGIRGTEFNSRICLADCAAEEIQLAGGDAADSISEGLYVNVDDGRVFLDNDAAGSPLDLDQGESGYVADVNSLPVRLTAVPAFLALDRVPSPATLDFDNIEIPEDVFDAQRAEAGLAGNAAAGGDELSREVELSGTYAGIDVSGTYEIEVSYGPNFPLADRKWFWGASPDIVFTLDQDGDKMTGEFSGDLEGTIKGVVDDDQVAFEFLLEARGGETKSGYGTWTIQDGGNLEGDFNIKDRRHGIVRGDWTLTRIVASGSSAFGIELLFVFAALTSIVYLARRRRRC